MTHISPEKVKVKLMKHRIWPLGDVDQLLQSSLHLLQADLHKTPIMRGLISSFNCASGMASPLDHIVEW